ncbi:MAG TPA: hypothetical protein VM120_12425 [Bryobacteraceae bacterium]|nr:hypothetical protein [Bryobacteraceae bacterium]
MNARLERTRRRFSRRAFFGWMGASTALATDTGVAPRRLWADDKTSHLGAPSPDGRFISMVDVASGDLAIRDTGTGVVTRLTGKQEGSKEFAYFSAISRDSRRIAFAWFNARGFYELRVVNADGSGARVLHSNEERRFVQPCAWSADGKQILTLFFRNDNISQIALVSVSDASVKVLKSLDWVYPNKMDLSPDGRWVIYDDLLREGEGARGLFLLATDGSSRKPAIAPQIHDVFPLFTRDGKGVLFLSTREGSSDLWMQPLAGGKAQLLRKNMGRALPLGISDKGDYYYALRAGQSAVYIADLDGMPGNARVIGEGTGTPEWSPDGSRVAYVARAANENFGQDSRSIVIHDVSSGGHRTLAPKIAWFDHLRWSPDGKRFLAGGSDRHGQRGLYSIDAATGAVTPLVRIPASTYEGFEGVWLDGGKSVCYWSDDDSTLRLLKGEGEPRQLYRAAGRGKPHDLVVSPGGRTVAFALRDAEADAVLILQIDGGSLRQVARVRGGGINGLSWTPDGKALLASAPSDPPGVWKIGLEGEPPRKLPWDLRQQGAVRVHPAGRYIAYTSGKTHTEIWVMERLVHATHHQR